MIEERDIEYQNLTIIQQEWYDCILSLCHVRVSEWIYTLQLPECQGTLCSKQARYPKFKWKQQHLNPQPHHSSIIWPVWINGWVFVYELNGCEFKPRCCHLRMVWFSKNGKDVQKRFDTLNYENETSD